MMNDYFQRLFEYDNWAKLRLANAIRTAPEIPERVVSVYGHLLASNHIWQSRLLGNPPQMGVWEPMPPESWQRQQELNHSQIIGFLQAANAGEFSKEISYKTTKGIPFENTVEGILSHMITHSNYHMGQINLLLKPVLDPLPDLMYISYQREQKA
jgi:uncharacterized damage-inducible protein DinB